MERNDEEQKSKTCPRLRELEERVAKLEQALLKMQREEPVVYRNF